MTIENPFAEYGETSELDFSDDDYCSIKKDPDFVKRFEAMRSEMGDQYWNHCDPVVLAIIDLIEAQNKIAYCEMDDGTYSYNYNYGQYMNNQMNWNKAIDERYAAAKQLVKAIRKQEAEAEERRRQWREHYDADAKAQAGEEK